MSGQAAQWGERFKLYHYRIRRFRLWIKMMPVDNMQGKAKVSSVNEHRIDSMRGETTVENRNAPRSAK
jgi:hypothetical protein